MEATKQLDSRIYAEVDQVGRDEWEELVDQFADSSIYQTWAYGVAHYPRASLSHAVLRRANGEAAAIAQVSIIRLSPWLGAAHVFWGPMWRRIGQTVPDVTCLRQMLRLLRLEYCHKRRLYLRLVPREIARPDCLAGAYEEEGFTRMQCVPAYRTLLVDLSLPIEQLRKGTRRVWRQQLSRAERGGLHIEHGTGIHLLKEALALYEEMRSRKGFVGYIDMNVFLVAQELLSDAHKVVVTICRTAGQPVAALAYSVIGDTALPVIAATGSAGLKLNASYLLWWKMIEDVKTRGSRWCDLGGINPQRTWGTYIFRSGLAGKDASDVRFLGLYGSADNRVLQVAARLAEYARTSGRQHTHSLWERLTQKIGMVRLTPAQDVQASKLE